MDSTTLQSSWNGFNAFDPDLDRAISSLLQDSNEPTPSNALPSWCTSAPFSDQLDGLPYHNGVNGDAAFDSTQQGTNKAPFVWSNNPDSGMASYLTSQIFGSGPGMATPTNAESLKGDMGALLGQQSPPDASAGNKAVPIEEIMDLDDFAKDVAATPHLSPTSMASMSPLDANFDPRSFGDKRDPLTQYHSSVAAGHARHLSELVDPGHLLGSGHRNAKTLASSLSHAVLPLASRPRQNTVSGMTLQQRRRMSLLAQRSVADTTTARKRQMSAPGSCLQGIITSPEFEKVKLQQGPLPSAVAASVADPHPEPTIPATLDVQDSWEDVVLTNSHDLVFVLSLKGTVLYISPSVERILGFLQEEIIGRALIDFCHPADIGPFSRELKESTTVPAGEEDSGSEGAPPKASPKVNLIMRMNVKGGGYNLIEATGSLSVDPPKHRKVVVCSGRPHPIPMLPWEHVRVDLLDPRPSAWLKLSHNGIFLGCTGPVSRVLGVEDVNLVGRHIRDLPMVASSTELLEALRCGRTISVQDWIEGAQEQRSAVKLTVYPWTSNGRSNNVAFVHVQQRDAADASVSQVPSKRKASPSSNEVDNSCLDNDNGAGGLTGSFATVGGGTTRFMSQGDAASTVFSELTGYHNGSWLVEMQKLQNANKRLRNELQALNKRSAHRSSLGARINA
ncbi:uncharacterized protein PFL1_00446 [Pseudozyma flocculosa PF-1]|uniref:Related to white collar 1 protein n=1 Tax=Pseudozyma flocculosa TaxID=84751 RepID=A0A5C3ESG6_9BASI|nr:uncharacterized protein PFL1_00446 [Pseudozyma flocculosa PF-1]EPQ32249.1 hypothetical protein PFL1_00446 [Pseudozyma flocculosa PF-1]SPO34800.1 related to white collar 1 protein [Pseudozyma flocculosa]